jgi:hypothetical protein
MIRKFQQKDFHNVVLKVQIAVLMFLIHRDDAAVHCLRKDGRVDGEQVASHAPPKQLRLLTRNRWRRKGRSETKTNYGEYRKCDFIHGSAAEIERVWSAA